MKRYILFTFSFIQLNNVFAQPDTLRGLQDDIFLHPANSNTAYTLRKNEIVYNQAPQGLPLPTWAHYGITDKVTFLIDNNFIAGLFIKPHLPVPSLNVRIKLASQNRLMPALALETSFQYLYVEFDQANSTVLSTWRQGPGGYCHLNASWKTCCNLYIHSSIGFTYVHHLRLVNRDTLNYQEKTYTDHISPDISLGLDYRLKMISFHLNSSYGSTFNYLDNVPTKFEIMYGIRMAPFYKNRHGFLRNFRFEWMGFYNEFRQVDVHAYLPFFIPYLYWQWTMKRK